MAEPGLIAVDWGTTRLRAWLVDADGRVLDRTAADEGIMAVPPGGFPADAAPPCRRLARAQHRPLPVVMAGMVGSRNGWVEAPYVACPAGVGRHRRGAGCASTSATACTAASCPGLSRRDAAGVPDVMRGEETKLAGCGVADGIVVMPGTHAKWARMRGRPDRGLRHLHDRRFLRRAAATTRSSASSPRSRPTRPASPAASRPPRGRAA